MLKRNLTSKKNLMEAVPESSSLHKAKSMASNLDLEKPNKYVKLIDDLLLFLIFCSPGPFSEANL